MSDFVYTALDTQGRRQRGSVRATNRQEAIAALQDKQWQVISVAGAPGNVRKAARRQSADAQALGLLIDEMATLLEAGVPLAEAIATLAESHPEDHPLTSVLRSVRGGSAFSAALAESGLKLPVYALQLVRAGESTGQLAAALRAAAQHLEAERAFNQEARSALIYPAVLVGSGILATLVMFVFVVPRFAAILDNPKADLPWISKAVLQTGLWLTQHQFAVALVVAAVAALAAYASQQASVRRSAWELAGRLPVLGPWTVHAELARWASLFSVLLNSRVPLLGALAQANETLRGRSLRGRADLVLGEVRGGKPLSRALADHALLEPAGLNLIRVGERAGSLGATVASLARMHAIQSQTRLKRFLVLLEPLAILGISVVLGGIMISVMLAITSLTNVR